LLALSTVDNTRDYARVSHSRQWSNYNLEPVEVIACKDLYPKYSIMCRAGCKTLLTH